MVRASLGLSGSRTCCLSCPRAFEVFRSLQDQSVRGCLALFKKRMLVLVSDHVAPDQQDMFDTVHAA
eukprot:10874884-Alexandrium_andersonii.AAC.1